MATKIAYERLFKSPNGKIVMADFRKRWLDSKVCMGGEDTIRRGAEHDVIQTIINMTKPLEK